MRSEVDSSEARPGLACACLAHLRSSPHDQQARLRGRAARRRAVGGPAAELDYFLLIDHIKGESQDSQHPDEIDIKNWAWGLSNAGSPPVGGGGVAGKPRFPDFS